MSAVNSTVPGLSMTARVSLAGFAAPQSKGSGKVNDQPTIAPAVSGVRRAPVPVIELRDYYVRINHERVM